MLTNQIISISENNDGLEESLYSVDPCTLVIFNYNDVIATNDNLSLILKNKEFWEEIANKTEKHLESDKMERLLAVIRKKVKWKLVNPKWAAIISRIQSQGAKCLLMTAHGTGKLADIDNIEDMRINELKELGIDFSRLWEIFDTFTFENFSKSHPVKNKTIGEPMFKKGVLFSCGFAIEQVLKRFMCEYKIKPCKIVFIDEDINNINIIKNECEKSGIEFCGIEYTVIKKLNEEKFSLKNINECFEKLQEIQEDGAENIKEYFENFKTLTENNLQNIKDHFEDLMKKF